MKRTIFYLLTLLIVLQLLCPSLKARPITGDEAATVVRGWLRADPEPLGARMGREVSVVEAFTNEFGNVLYYIVSLDPSGFVIVPADDRVEPIMGFAQSGNYDSSSSNPLTALVTNDINRRLISAIICEQVTMLDDSADETKTSATDAQKTKWHRYIKLATSVSAKPGLKSKTTDQMDDLRVAPLIETRWDQTTCWTEENDVMGNSYMVNSIAACYNFYTPPSDPCDPCDYLVPSEYSGIAGTYGDPNNYPSGCVATAMAQLMHYHQWPQEGIGKKRFDIQVKYDEQWISEEAWTRGGDGLGGPYDWANMFSLPECSDPSQLKAIGALCYDAGVSIGMKYTPEGSAPSYPWDVSTALKQTFNYNNAIAAVKAESGYAVEIGAALTQMINPNLDAGKPVILAMEGQEVGHSVICDGYGFNSSTIYYHLNMGGTSYPEDCTMIWYQLVPPDISYDCTWCECTESNCPCYLSDWSYDTVMTCIYNIFAENNGEIISGRVLDVSGKPVVGITVSAESTSNPNDSLSDETNPNGIFAFVGCQSETEYVVSIKPTDANYPFFKVKTGISESMTTKVGNIWNLEFIPLGPRYVPGDLPTIQEAVDAAFEGQVIIIRPGTYTGDGNRDIDFKGKAITIMSENGPETCIIDCQGTEDDHHRGFYFHSDETSSSVVEGLTITNGYHDEGGAIYCTGDSDPIIRNCVFGNNTAASKGGAFYNDDSNPIIITCQFNNNYVGVPDANTGEGGAIYNAGSSPQIISAVFANNFAQNSGGAIYNGSTEVCKPDPGTTICTQWSPGLPRICLNWITLPCIPPPCYQICVGFAPIDPLHPNLSICTQWITICPPCPPICHDQRSLPILRNCTFVGNTSTNGFALDLDENNSITLQNCILWENSPEQVSNSERVNVSYSNLQGGFDGEGNINDDPLFVDPDNGNYRLQANSPCINAGDPNILIGQYETDLDGNPRIVDGRIDMGAYEFIEMGLTP